MNRVKELRKEHKITQEKLAASLGISRSAVAMYETGKCDLSNEILIACASFFDVSTDYLLGQSDIKKAPSTEVLSATPEAQALREILVAVLLQLRSISPNSRNKCCWHRLCGCKPHDLIKLSHGNPPREKSNNCSYFQ